MLMRVGCPCPPVRNDIVTPSHLFLFLLLLSVVPFPLSVFLRKISQCLNRFLSAAQEEPTGKKIPSILTLDDHMMFTQLIEFRASFQYAVILLFLLLSIGRSLCFKSTFREIVVKIKFALTIDS